MILAIPLQVTLFIVFFAVIYVTLILYKTKLLQTYFSLFGWSKKYDQILTSKFPFFNSLNSFEKDKFRKRVRIFMHKKNFESGEQFQITIEIELLIDACVVSITFGLQEYPFPSFNLIIVYPEKNFSSQFKQDIKGESTGNRIIRLSWKNIQLGNQNSNDNINLGYTILTSK